MMQDPVRVATYFNQDKAIFIVVVKGPRKLLQVKERLSVEQ